MIKNCDDSLDPKTGRFRIKTQTLPGRPEGEMQALRWRLWNELAGCVAFSMRDGRAYTVLYSGVEYVDEGEQGGQHHVFDFTILIYVTNAREAAVGEWVWNLPVEVPDDDMREWRAPWGAVFKLCGQGWRRIE